MEIEVNFTTENLRMTKSVDSQFEILRETIFTRSQIRYNLLQHFCVRRRFLQRGHPEQNWQGIKGMTSNGQIFLATKQFHKWFHKRIECTRFGDHLRTRGYQCRY
uniref:Uncharacterized protein n=1 Tax=Parascaris equorum TaxID=6256 RepID=A0A914RBD4_PAREQ